MKRANSRGQALVESLLIAVILTAAVFAAFQLCVIAVNDMIFNEAAFAAMRSAAVSQGHEHAEKQARATAKMILLPHFAASSNNLVNYSVRLWDNEPLGKNMLDHSGTPVIKCNTNIEYSTKIMFASLIKPFHNFSFFSGGNPLISQTARARLIQSPDRDYYYKAFPGADNFTNEK
ncbi:MAG TPA: hypothetical protein DEE98_00035 [Elusimicrobia bacterium]|nr:MAG: hypothetical protein A2251_00800 [Elusimicrobia bacterium RIFOXYA2_FULL_47_53]OGS26759.1 MAG: hypothetical protein A2339_04055 [Elusimicrobia bacterium RIFOXYB12_FULL_50_12]OGS31665.1 MAG: hypothetical protein A2323_05630 [Elusimicrobia bacterium RIFOXYB2_FULL_46_23]HBU68753.1 hypothetical protein [Elusimicrobiota bacterium]